jgi:hypothetical protein
MRHEGILHQDNREHEIVQLACEGAGGEWQGRWARRDGVQAGGLECSLRGDEFGPTGGDRGNECGSARALECGPRLFGMQAATPISPLVER